MKKLIAACVACVTILPLASVWGVKKVIDNKLSSASQMHERLFVHYLQGSGQNVDETFFTEEEVNQVKQKCKEDIIANFIIRLSDAEKKVGLKSSVESIEIQQTTYDEEGSPLNLSLGNYTCKSDGARDVYDFRYAPEQTGVPIGTFQFYVDAVNCVGTGDAPRCLVRLGYGKPFDVNIKF